MTSPSLKRRKAISAMITHHLVLALAATCCPGDI